MQSPPVMVVMNGGGGPVLHELSHLEIGEVGRCVEEDASCRRRRCRCRCRCWCWCCVEGGHNRESRRGHAVTRRGAASLCRIRTERSKKGRPAAGLVGRRREQSRQASGLRAPRRLRRPPAQLRRRAAPAGALHNLCCWRLRRRWRGGAPSGSTLIMRPGSCVGRKEILSSA